MKKVQLVTTTATFAGKARDILKNNGISAEIKKVQGGTAAGCLFGIVVAEAAAGRAVKLLGEANIRIISQREVGTVR